jgi:hypothetical protein
VRRKSEAGWAIVGNCGLYVGWHRSRSQTIAQHVSDLWSGRGGFGEISPYGSRLDDQQKLAWAKCKANGDRAVKVTITYTDAPH